MLQQTRKCHTAELSLVVSRRPSGLCERGAIASGPNAPTPRGEEGAQLCPGCDRFGPLRVLCRRAASPDGPQACGAGEPVWHVVLESQAAGVLVRVPGAGLVEQDGRQAAAGWSMHKALGRQAVSHRLKASSTPLVSPAARRCFRASATSPAASR